MIREYDFNCIQSISDGNLIYEVNDKVEKIDIKKSGERWWDMHHKSSIWDVILKRKSKNIYAGGKFFSFTKSYIRLYTDEDEIIFNKKMPDDLDSSDACEFRMWWEKINMDFHQQGYWLFDEG